MREPISTVVMVLGMHPAFSPITSFSPNRYHILGICRLSYSARDMCSSQISPDSILSTSVLALGSCLSTLNTELSLSDIQSDTGRGTLNGIVPRGMLTRFHHINIPPLGVEIIHGLGVLSELCQCWLSQRQEDGVDNLGMMDIFKGLVVQW